MNDELNGSGQNNLENPEEKKLFSTMPPVTAAFFALATVFIIYQFGGAILTLLIFGMDFENADINLVRLLTVGGQILLILLPALLFSKFVYIDITNVLRVKMPRVKEIINFIIGFIILSPLLQSYLYIQNFTITKIAESNTAVKYGKDLIDQLDKVLQSTYGNLLASNNVFETLFVIVVIAVVPALCEEVFFRGFVQKSFEQKYKPFRSALITAFFFGIYHFNPYGLVALIALGAYFGFAAYMSNSILIPIILHFLNNFLAVLVFLIFGNDELISSSVSPQDGILSELIGFVILLILFTWFISYIIKDYKKNTHEQIGGSNDLSSV